MNKVLGEIKKIIDDSIRKYLPDVKSSDLEDNGNIYYMNGKNGTEFDWYVNDRISDFMVFYDDENKLGALKLSLYNDGTTVIYIYGDHGSKLIKEIETSIKVTQKEMLNLAVILKNEADDKRIFDGSIFKIDSDKEVSKEKIDEFQKEKKYFDKIRAQKEVLNLKALVSERIIKEGYKVGYMIRCNPHDAMDSGWQFLAGDEDDAYLNDVKKIELLPVGYVCNLDPDISKYINYPVGTELIRISSSKFEIDKHTKEIYIEKRNSDDIDE